MIKAKVKWFNKNKGFGFATADGIPEDIFIHHSIIEMEGFRNLGENQTVSLQYVKADDGRLRATKVIPR